MHDTADNQPLLETRGLRKSYGASVALDGVDVKFYAGQVHALMGENGAGKSTLGKIIAGAVPSSGGEIWVDGESAPINNPVEAQRRGITIIFQELDLFPHLSIAENIAIQNLRYQESAWVNYKKMEAFARPALKRVGLDLPPRRLVGELSVAQQQRVAIARALSMDARLIVFDESTSALTSEAVDQLFGVIDQLRAAGVACVFVTHKMDEVFRIADRITVLRDGKYIGTRNSNETDMAELVRMMIGHEVVPGGRDSHTQGQTLLEVDGLETAALHDVSFRVRKGEVVGLAGLVGAGRGEVGRALFGLDKITGGSVTLGGKPYIPSSPRSAMNRGLALLPRDRKGQGLMMQMSVRENASLAVLPRVSTLGWVGRGEEARRTDQVSQATRIKSASPHIEVSSLSGGNQQKALLGRWLLTDADLYFLDDPTRGVDIGAKEDIYQIIQDLAKAGKGVIMVSSELPELMQCCDRIVVMNDGRSVADLPRDEATQEQILTYATSASPGVDNAARPEYAGSTR